MPALHLPYFHSPGSPGNVELPGMEILQNILDILIQYTDYNEANQTYTVSYFHHNNHS